MTWYKSQRHNNFRYIFRRWLITSLILSSPLLMDFLQPQLNLVDRSFWYMFIPTFSIFRFIGLCQEDRVNEIIVDTGFREITFKYYDFNEGQVWKSYPFEILRVEILSGKPHWPFKQLHITFLKGRREVMSLSKSKDGFSLESLESLKKTLLELTSPVKTSYSG